MLFADSPYHGPRVCREICIGIICTGINLDGRVEGLCTRATTGHLLILGRAGGRPPCGRNIAIMHAWSVKTGPIGATAMSIQRLASPAITLHPPKRNLL